jgi:hypothetical protein
MRKLAFVIALLALVAYPVLGQEAKPAEAPPNKVLPSGAKVYIAPMDDKFDEFLKNAIKTKDVPLTVVAEKAQAQFEITGHSETQKASTAKKVIMWDWRSNEQASIQVANLESGLVIFAYSVNKVSSTHGKKSSAEACAKHLKEKIASRQ